ncbi:Fanconi anemia group F protein [Ctenodactylus gundi]
MEALLQHLECFSEVLAVSRTPHVSTWAPETVRRALEWACYLRHVFRRFGHHGCIRTALERRLLSQWRREGETGPRPVPGLANFQALGRCDILLCLNLLRNRALGDAACHYLLQQLRPGGGVRDAGEEALQDRLARLARRRAAIHLLSLSGYQENPSLREDSLMRTQAELLLQRLREVGRADAGSPGRLLCSLGERVPRDHFLQVVAVALLQSPSTAPPPEEQGEPSSSKTPGEGSQELILWLLEKSEIMTAFCRNLPGTLLTSVASRHPAISRVYLDQLIDWSRCLHYDLQKGAWVGAESQDVTWEELYDRFQSLCQGPPPLKDDVLTALQSYKAQDGDFEVPGVSIWTDLLLALRSGTNKSQT